jgi:hypothetical protein
MRNIIIFASLLSAPALADAPHKLVVTSNAFVQNTSIPMEYTCEGASQSPEIAWTSVPAASHSVALLVDDPDAPKGVVTHWLVTDIKPSITELGANASLPEHAIAMKNEKGKLGYMGPCPPSGEHHYHFRVYALDTTIGKLVNRSEFLGAIKGHVLAEGELVGTYKKQH